MALLKQQGHAFAIGKVTGEGDYVNPYYRPNHDRAVAAGVIPGGYDWVEPQDARSGAWLAEDYLRVIGPRPQGYLLTVDFETPDWYKGHRGRNIEPFMKEYLYTLLEKAKQPILIYTAPYFLQETGAQYWTWLAKDFFYWMAAPGSGMVDDNAPWHGTMGGPWSVMTMHQHQWYAKSAAIGSGANFDRNRFNGTLAELKRIGYQGGISQAEVISGGLGRIKEDNQVQEPAAGKWTTYINDKGESVFVWNAGGKAKRILGVNVQDIGLSVENDDNETFDISIQNNEAHPWRERG